MIIHEHVKSSSQIIACDIPLACDITLAPIIWFPFINELCTARLIVILSINFRFKLAYIQEYENNYLDKVHKTPVDFLMHL